VLGVDIPYSTGAELRPSALDQSFKGTTTGPHYSQTIFEGNRRPAVDGFLSFLNLTEAAVKPAPVQVDIEFGRNGEVVNLSTFRATLNNQDVTGAFKATDPKGKTLRAVFQLELSPLKAGKNVLFTTVDGIVPGTTRTGTDADRLTFTVR
jgi:hypothetical protein